MKKTSLLVVLPAVVLSGLLLNGCSLFHSHKAWETAKQETPLEIPPSLDRPAATEALVIPPPGANNPTSSGAVATVGAVAADQIADGFVLNDSVEHAYQRVGKLLQDGKLATVVAHDDATHGYTLSVSDASLHQKKKGFFGRLFGHKSDVADTSSAASHEVKLSITANGANASEIRAEGATAAVARVIDTLKSKLGS